jgi:hypothetical protein
MEIPNTFKEFLTLIGSPIFIGVVISVLLVRWEWFVNLPNKAKFWLVGVICVFLPIASQALVLYLPAGVVVFIEFWWPPFVVGVGMWTSTQIWNILFGANGVIKRAATIKQINAPTKQQSADPVE